MYELLDELKLKDQEFVSFCEKATEQKDLQVDELLKRMEGILSLKEKVDQTSYSSLSEEDAKKYIKEKTMWNVERGDYYKQVARVYSEIKKTKRSIVGDEYAILLQTVTLYDKLKQRFDVHKDIASQIRVLHSLQDRLNNFYKDIFQVSEDLESKLDIPRVQMDQEKDEEYLQYLKQFFDKTSKVKDELKKELVILKKGQDEIPYTFYSWKDDPDFKNNFFYQRLSEKLPDIMSSFWDYFETSSEVKTKFLKENALYADAEQNNPMYFEQNKKYIIRRINELTSLLQQDGYDLSFITEMGVVSQLLQYIKLFCERKEKFTILGIKREIAADLQELKYKINQYFQILSKMHGQGVVLIYEEEIPRIRGARESSEEYLNYLKAYQFTERKEDNVLFLKSLEEDITQALPVSVVADASSLNDFNDEVSLDRSDDIPLEEKSSSEEEQSISLEEEVLDNSPLEPEYVIFRRDLITHYQKRLNEFIHMINAKIKSLPFMSTNKFISVQETDLKELYQYGEEFAAVSEELERVNEITEEDILNENIALNIKENVTIEELVQLRKITMLKKMSNEEIKSEIKEKIKQYEKRTGKFYAIKEEVGVPYVFKRRLSDDAFTVFKDDTEIFLKIAKMEKTGFNYSEKKKTKKQETDSLKPLPLHLGEGFYISLNTLSVVVDQNNEFVYKRPLYGPDVERIIEGLLFYETKTKTWQIATDMDSANQFYFSGLKLIAVQGQDGIYRVEDVLNLHKKEIGRNF